MAAKKPRVPAPFRSILFEELGAEAAGRAAELGIRLIPRDAFEDLLRVMPEKVLKKDDLQDAIARIPRMGARLLGYHPLVAEVVQVATKEALEEVGNRASEIPATADEQRIFARRVVHDLPAFKRLEQLRGGVMTEKKPAAKSIKQVLGEILAAPLVDGDPEWNKEYNKLLANLSPDDRKIELEQGTRRSTTTEQLKVILLMTKSDLQREAYMHMLQNAPLLQPEKSPLENALEAVGVKNARGHLTERVHNINAGLKDSAAALKAKNDRRGRLF